MRVSTTTVESFRLFREPSNEWMTADMLRESILNRTEPTPAMRRGSAFGRILATPDAFRADGGYRCDGYSFDDATMAPCLALMDHQHGVFEAKGVRRYGEIDVVAQVDQVVGLHIYEHKTTESFAVEKYLDSCQWKFYLDVFGARVVTYHVFVLDDHENGVVELRDTHSFNVFAYPQLHDDCAELVEAFAHYARTSGVADALRRRQQEAA